MKSPREILLARHRSAESQLDAMRRRLVVSLTEARAGSSRGWSLLELVWTHWIAPCRPVWSGLAVAWVAIALLQFDTARLRPPASRGAAVMPPAPAWAAAWAERRVLGLEHDATVTASSPAEERIPAPRSERAYPDFDRRHGYSRGAPAVPAGVARTARRPGAQRVDQRMARGGSSPLSPWSEALRPGTGRGPGTVRTARTC